MLLESSQCNFGWKAPDFRLKDPDGRSYALSEQLGEQGLLIAFLCNHCPYVQAVAERFVQDAQVLQAQGVGVLAIMPNDYHKVRSDAPDRMKLFARDYGFTFPYLVDEAHSVASAFDAVCTPDFFGFNSSGELQYRGRLDDARMCDSEHRTPELLNAMLQIARTGQGPREQFPSMGCSIKWRA